jgi:hypothetical protein
MEEFWIAQSRPPTAMSGPKGKKIFMVRSFDFPQDRWITQAFLRFSYGFFSFDLLRAKIRSKVPEAVDHEVTSR